MKTTASIYKSILYISGCCFFMLLATVTHAQTHGRVEVIKDPRVDTLIARRFNAHGGSNEPGGFSSSGYRVQVYSGADRNAAFKAQTKFQQNYPDVRTYITYREPNFKVHVGDYRTRLEATRMLEQLRSSFGLMFIIAEKINPPKLDSDPPNQ